MHRRLTLHPSFQAAPLAAFVVLLATPLYAGEPVFNDIFVAGHGGYHTYRIPALLVTPKGTVLAFTEGRKTSRSDHGDIDMLLRRSTDGGATWLRTQVVHEEGGTKKITIGNPCPVVDRSNGRIWLPFTRDNDDVFVTYSDDEGATWSTPREITKDVKAKGWTWYATGPGVGIQIERGPHAGRLVIPCDHREPYKSKTAKMSHVFYSDDHGETWQLGETVAPHTDECQVAERPDGSLIINMRNYWARDGKQKDKGGKRVIATSDDGGATWSDIWFDDALLSPVCQAGLFRYSWPGDDGASGDTRSVLMYTGPASRSKRHKLTIRLSYDEGKTWPASRLVYEGGSAYSSPAVMPDGKVGILFEPDGYKRITLVTFPLSWVTAGSE